MTIITYGRVGFDTRRGSGLRRLDEALARPEPARRAVEAHAGADSTQLRAAPAAPDKFRVPPVWRKLERAKGFEPSTLTLATDKVSKLSRLIKVRKRARRGTQ